MLRIFAFFSLDFFSGDRASDLRRIKTVDVSRHPDGSSLLFHQRVGKTLRGKTSRAFALKQTANPAICPCEISSSSSSFAIQCDLTFPLVFSSVQLPKQVVSLMPPSSPLPFKPDWSSYLSSLGINDGETVHGFRSGTSILLRLLGVSREVALLPSALAGSLRRWLTTILKWTRLCLPIPLPIPWLVVRLSLDAALWQNFSRTLSANLTVLLVLRRPFCKSFPVFIALSF